ncbi:MAG: ABC transporter substrate-binding protein [Myxococcaceae bacterium]
MRGTLFAVFAALAILSAVACERGTGGTAVSAAKDAAVNWTPEATPLVMGAVVSLTGPESSFGISTKQGIELAVSQANASGGVKGQPVSLKIHDDRSVPSEAAAATRQLIDEDNVRVVLGEILSASSLAMANVAQAAKVPMITPSSTNPKVTAGRDWVSRVCFIDSFQGYAMARFAREHLKVTRAAILHGMSDYSVGLANVFTKQFTERGGNIVQVRSYTKGDSGFHAQLTAIRNAKPEVVYVPGYYTDVGNISRQAREVGLVVPLLGADGWDAAKLYELGGGAVEGHYFSTHYSPQDPSPKTQRFIAEYKARFGTIPDAIAALGYDAALVALDAMKRANSLERAAIRDAIAQTRDLSGATGNITLDEERNAVKPAVIVQVTQGASRYVTAIAPP